MLDGRIVGGVAISISDAPYQVALLLDYWNTGYYSQSCGGSIISRNVVLTAAHCTNGYWFVNVSFSRSADIKLKKFP